jgi:acyl-CoA reductase-like NAD-dependent aldehyde dehydrogenase
VEQVDWLARAKLAHLRARGFVNGRWCVDGPGEALPKFSPRDGTLLYTLAAADPLQVDEAVSAARASFEDGRWSDLPVQRRKDVLHKLASLIESHHEEFALLECLDVGKPISDALHFDVPSAVASIRFNAEAVDKVYGKVYGADRTSLSYELLRPAGVVAAVVGWNFPLYLAAQKIGPALAAGNSLILKPSELTSLSAARVAELAIEAGVPEGIFNVIHGDGRVGAALARHGEIELLTFTGSSRTGKALLVAAGESNMKRLILECGGKTPNIVFDDCPDVEAVARSVAASAFWNQGQVCIASSRLLVQEGIREELLTVLTREVTALTAGDPLKPDTRHGALVSRNHQQKVMSFIERGEKEGSRRIHCSNTAPPIEGGFYVPATLFDGVSEDSAIARDEIFGPVLTVLSFKNDEEAIRIANGTIYGLASIAWTKDPARAHRLAQSVRSGSMMCYATARPKGGPSDAVLSLGGHKQSGWGVEGGVAGVEEYLSRTAVQVFV